MKKKDIIVIGGSAGCFPALLEIVGMLPAGLKAAVLIVMHIPPYAPSLLPQILSRAGALPARHARDGETLKKGRIYVAPPDRQLLLEGRRLLVQKGPRENRFRPSIDALFRSAAYSYGSRVVGVVLSGLLDDGTSGLWTIKRRGGLCVIQEPREAICASMPASVLEYVEVDYILPSPAIGRLLLGLTGGTGSRTPVPVPDERKQPEAQGFAAQPPAAGSSFPDVGCPEWNDLPVQGIEGNRSRHPCFSGPSLTNSALLSDAYKIMEEGMWQAIRVLEEVVVLLLETARQFERSGNLPRAQEFQQKAQETLQRSVTLREQLFLLKPVSR